MKIRPIALLPVLVAGALLAPLGFSPTAFAACSIPKPKPLRFNSPVFVDQHRSGGEPVSVVARDGSIIVGAHLGTTLLYDRTIPDPDWLTHYMNQTLVWRSTDDGATWSRIESIPGLGMHSPTSTGFSDPDFAKDSAGNLYGTEIDLANVSVFSSHDNGVTWPDANAVADSGDRPWLAARGPGVVYLTITGDLEKSTDGGATWTTLTDPPGYGKIYVDPTDPQGLFDPTDNGVAVSRDDGRTWASYSIPGGTNNSVMDSIGVDKQGWVYYGLATPGGMQFSSWDPASRTWAAPVSIPHIGSGTPLWAWTVAGDAGRAAVGWYQATPLPNGDTSLSAYVAVTTNARGSKHRCPNGTVISVPPQFSVADAAGRPIHVGQMPCAGTGCNATGDRRLGDYFTINYDAQGKVFVTTGDTTLTQTQDLEGFVSHPLFMIATGSSPRLKAG